LFHIQFDEIPTLLGLQEPLLRLADWFEARVLKETFNAALADNGLEAMTRREF
jgi:hypothetical protein